VGCIGRRFGDRRIEAGFLYFSGLFPMIRGFPNNKNEEEKKWAAVPPIGRLSPLLPPIAGRRGRAAARWHPILEFCFSLFLFFLETGVSFNCCRPTVPFIRSAVSCFSVCVFTAGPPPVQPNRKWLGVTAWIYSLFLTNEFYAEMIHSERMYNPHLFSSSFYSFFNWK